MLVCCCAPYTHILLPSRLAGALYMQTGMTPTTCFPLYHHYHALPCGFCIQWTAAVLTDERHYRCTLRARTALHTYYRIRLLLALHYHYHCTYTSLALHTEQAYHLHTCPRYTLRYLSYRLLVNNYSSLISVVVLTCSSRFVRGILPVTRILLFCRSFCGRGRCITCLTSPGSGGSWAWRRRTTQERCALLPTHYPALLRSSGQHSSGRRRTDAVYGGLLPSPLILLPTFTVCLPARCVRQAATSCTYHLRAILLTCLLPPPTYRRRHSSH